MIHADVLTTGLKGVFCGINYPPSALGPQNFATKSNRFWRTLHRAGFTDVELSAQEDRRLLDYGYGITATVPRATRRAEELSAEEIRQARPAFEARIRKYAPRAIAFLGKRALAAMLGRSDVEWGLQREPFASATTWVLPNPSGRNLAYDLEALVHAYAEFRYAVEASPRAEKSSRLNLRRLRMRARVGSRAAKGAP